MGQDATLGQALFGAVTDTVAAFLSPDQATSQNERHFIVIIRGLTRRYWQFKAQLCRDESEVPFPNIWQEDYAVAQEQHEESPALYVKMGDKQG